MRKVAALFVGAWVIVVAFPYLWVLAASFKTQKELIDPRSFIFAHRWQKAAIERPAFGKFGRLWIKSNLETGEIGRA